jgi:hypothetical protein
MCKVAPHGHTRSDAFALDPSQSGVRKHSGRNRKHRRKEHLMLDVVMLVLALSFFALGIGYAYACERL